MTSPMPSPPGSMPTRSPQDLEALEDTLDLLSDPGAMAEIEPSRGDAVAGRVFDAAQLRAKYLT